MRLEINESSNLSIGILIFFTKLLIQVMRPHCALVGSHCCVEFYFIELLGPRLRDDDIPWVSRKSQIFYGQMAFYQQGKVKQ